MTTSETTGFAPAVLQCLDVLVPSGQTVTDLACELGLSAWMRVTGTELDDAPRHLWAAREAVLEAGGLDPDTEPVPLVGRTSRADLLTLVGYLRDLVARAAAHQGCDRATLIARALERPVIHRVAAAPSPRRRELRSS